MFRDVRFRRALSLGISRKAINKVLYFGLAKERAVAALEESPFFDPENATAWARFDLDEANRLLDEIGLVERNAVRHPPSARRPARWRSSSRPPASGRRRRTSSS